MARWIAFDSATAAKLRSHVPQDSVFEAPGRSAFEYAVETPRTVITVLAGQVKGEPLIAVFRPPRQAAIVEPAAPVLPAQATSSGFHATGFLGLQDEVPEEDEKESGQRKHWWQRWWK